MCIYMIYDRADTMDHASMEKEAANNAEIMGYFVLGKKVTLNSYNTMDKYF